MRVVFIGAGDIGIPALDALVGSREHELAAVVTQPDRPAGRRRRLTPTRVKARADAAGVPVLQPERIESAAEALRGLEPEVLVVAAYGQILPRAVLAAPRVACLNIHASLLPRHRGASPVQAAIREGDAGTGVTIMWMDEGLDTGDVLLAEAIGIGADETGGTLHDKLAELAPGCLMRALELLARGEAPRVPQDPGRVTMTRKLGRGDGRILWERGAAEIGRLVRAYDPWPGTFCLLPPAGGRPAQLKVHRVRVVDGAEACAVGGTVLSADGALLVSCGSGVIELLEVQPEGGRRMSAAEFLRGHPLEAGCVLH